MSLTTPLTMSHRAAAAATTVLRVWVQKVLRR